MSSIPARIRTGNLRLRRPTLYPVELRGPDCNCFCSNTLETTQNVTGREAGRNSLLVCQFLQLRRDAEHCNSSVILELCIAVPVSKRRRDCRSVMLGFGRSGERPICAITLLSRASLVPTFQEQFQGIRHIPRAARGLTFPRPRFYNGNLPLGPVHRGLDLEWLFHRNENPRGQQLADRLCRPVDGSQIVLERSIL